MNQQPLDNKTVRRHLKRAHRTFNQTAVLRREVAKRLEERLDFMKIAPRTILNIGARLGYLAGLLQQRFASATLITLEQVADLLTDQIYFKDIVHKPIASGYQQLPFQDHSIDLIVSNLALHYSDNMTQCMAEFYRVLKPNGLLLFSTVGPDTLKELRDSFTTVDDQAHVYSFIDMHDLGDVLLQQGFVDPVMDAQMISMRYLTVKDLLHDLHGVGAQNALVNRQQGLMGKNKWQQMLAHYDTLRIEGLIPASFEIVYGSAWMPEKILRAANSHNEVVVPLSEIMRK
jgi:malonyl-CoA O-methyltransferase